MADKILFDGKKYQIFNHAGVNYKNNVSRIARLFYFQVFLYTLLGAIPLIFAYFAYFYGSQGNAACVLFGILTVVFTLVFALNIGNIAKPYNKWLDAEKAYNLALVDNIDNIEQRKFKEKEDLALHQLKMKKIQAQTDAVLFDKDITFHTTLEKSLKK